MHRAADVHQGHRHARGFTLVEMMVVVTIISIVSALVLPSMAQVVRDRHAQEAAMSVLDIVRETRSRAMYRGTAHTLLIETVGTTLRMHAYEGSTSSCRLSRFGGGLFDPAQRVYSLDMTTSAFTDDGIQAAVATTLTAASTSLSTLQLCFTPMGVTYFSLTPISDAATSMATFSNDSTAAGLNTPMFAVYVYRGTSSAPVGVPRVIMVPLSGMPRMRQ